MAAPHGGVAATAITTMAIIMAIITTAITTTAADGADLVWGWEWDFWAMA